MSTDANRARTAQELAPPDGDVLGRLAHPPGPEPVAPRCQARHESTGAICELWPHHPQNHRGPFEHGIAQWPYVAGPAAPSEPLLARPSDHECDGTNIAQAHDGRYYCAHCGWNEPAAAPSEPLPLADECEKLAGDAIWDWQRDTLLKVAAALRESEARCRQLQAEIADAREACPAVRMDKFAEAPLLALVNEQVSQLFRMQSQAEAAEARCQAVTAERDEARYALRQVRAVFNALNVGQDYALDCVAQALDRPGEAETTLRATLGSLVELWRGVANRHKTHGDCYRVGQGWGMEQCADELEQVLGAAPREGEGR